MATENKQQLQMGDDIQTMSKKPYNRCWIVLCIILLLCCLGLLVAVVVLSVYMEKGSAAVCNTPHCAITAGKLLENIDPQYDPCEKFEDFACGGFFKRNVIPEDKSRYTIFNILYNNMQVALKELFERETSSRDIAVERKVKDYYASCIDTDTIEERDAQPLVNLLNDFGGWPVLGDKDGGRWNESDYDLEMLMGRLSGELYISNLVFPDVRVDDKNPTQHVLQLDQPDLGMRNRDYFLDDQYAKYKEAYLNYMVAVATLLGADESTVMNDMKNVLEFEKSIANMTIPSQDRGDKETLYNPTTIADLQQSLPQIDWVKFFDVLMPSENKPLPLTERVINRSPIYLTNAVQLFVEDTQPRIVTNYLIWKLIMNHITSLSKRFTDAKQDYSTVLYGSRSATATWKNCVSHVNARVAFGTGRMYVTNNFPGDSKFKVQKMIANLKKVFKDMLEYNDWMDEATKDVAREKCDAIHEQVGYPDWIMDDNAINDYYAKLDVVRGQFFENNLSQTRWGAHLGFAKLRKLVDKEEWFTGPAQINAYYLASKNLIVFPAGILQPPFYHSDSPWYLNYGGIGVVIGHEITHGFDDSGRQYDKDGDLRQWWSDKSIENFNERAQCIVDQYSGYVMQENNKAINGIQTLGENIADNGGLKEAFQAYMENHYSSIKLPGMSAYSPEQLFYLNFAQVWCTLYTPEALDRAVLSSHTPARFRIIGTAHNSLDFAKAFNCPDGSYMNPPTGDRCSIW